jgi:hypothetical protein
MMALGEQQSSGLSVQRPLEAAGRNQSQAGRLLRIRRDALGWKMKNYCRLHEIKERRSSERRFRSSASGT